MITELPSKVRFTPITSRNIPINFLNKVSDMWLIVNKLTRLIKKNEIDFVIGRNSISGSICYKLYRKLGVPYAVESFEPHADYMLESGVWKKYDPRYLFQKYWEKKQKETASFLMPVSENHKRQLIYENVGKSKVITVPCCVDLEKFAFSKDARRSLRKRLNIKEQDNVGIYVGKFGDIYLDEESFELFRLIFEQEKSFFLIILTPFPDLASVRCSQYGLPKENVLISSVPHDLVNDYLSAADIAFSLVKPAPIRKYCSPIKDGEYSANGLPIAIPNGIGDDSDIIKKYGLGIIFDVKDLNNAAKDIHRFLNKKKEVSDRKPSILAKEFRSFPIVKSAYEVILNTKSNV